MPHLTKIVAMFIVGDDLANTRIMRVALHCLWRFREIEMAFQHGGAMEIRAKYFGGFLKKEKVLWGVIFFDDWQKKYKYNPSPDTGP